MSSITKDYLKEDPEIYNQRYVCLSFAEPKDQDVVKDRESFFAAKFLSKFITERDLVQQAKDSGKQYDETKLTSTYETIKVEYYDFLKTFENDLQTEFERMDSKNERVTMRGMKVRGVFRNIDEANQRAEQMRDFEPAFNVFVGQVGYWMPFNPISIDSVDSVYAEQQLNELIKGKNEEEEKVKAQFNSRKEDMIKKSIDENKDATKVQEVEITEEDMFEILDDEPVQTQTQKESSPAKKQRRRGGRRRRGGK